ncbi:biotin holocarboxylase synthetase [Elasticomyces elasticus]|nr:biotin holocarboxylase synthetase [Elasticomyces elasticus]
MANVFILPTGAFVSTLQSVQSLLLFFGPILLPKVLALYRSFRAPSNVVPVPLPSSTARALNLLFISAVLSLAATLPYFTPPNIFAQTASRLQTTDAVLFKRLSVLRELTPLDEAIRAVFSIGGMDARLLYMRFGPDTLTSCPLTDPRDTGAARAYYICTLPSLLPPHLFHGLILGLVTSTYIAGYHAGRWRTYATIASAGLAVIELWMLGNYDHAVNTGTHASWEINAFFWRLRFMRCIGVALVDALLGLVIYLSATQRAFVTPPSPAARVQASTAQIESALMRMNMLGGLRNAVLRNRKLRGRMEQFWSLDEQIMADVLTDQEVLDAFRGAHGTVDRSRLKAEAEMLVEKTLGPVGADSASTAASGAAH